MLFLKFNFYLVLLVLPLVFSVVGGGFVLARWGGIDILVWLWG